MKKPATVVKRRLLGIGGATLALASAAAGASDAPLALKMSGFLEAAVGHASLSAGNANWNDQYLRGHLRLTPSDALLGEVSRQSHFGEAGVFVGLTYKRVFDDAWYGSLGAGSSSGGFFLPRLRMDATLSRKWSERRNLVSSLGLGYYRARDVHSDRYLALSALYYFEAPWIAEIGIRRNESQPGGIVARRGFAALTHGSDKAQYLSLRVESGRESYQLVGPAATISDFSSRETTLVWRRWLARDAGFNARLGHYVNPSYKRTGIELGLFQEF